LPPSGGAVSQQPLEGQTLVAVLTDEGHVAEDVHDVFEHAETALACRRLHWVTRWSTPGDGPVSVRASCAVALAGLAVSCAVAICAHAVVADELQAALDVLREASVGGAAGAVALFVLVPLSNALTWHVALARGEHVPVVSSCSRYGIGSLVNTFLPGRAGDAVRLVLFRRLLTPVPLSALAARFGTLELARVLVFAMLPIAVADARVGVFALAIVARRFFGRVAFAVACAVGVRAAAFAVALAALHVTDPFSDALRIVPALEVAAILPLSPANVASSTVAVAAALGTTGLGFSDAVSIGLALHLFETAGGVAFGVLPLSALVATPLRRHFVAAARGRDSLVRHVDVTGLTPM
jgi:Lysylphosphatidylglycerol synthase TM region